MLTALGSGLWAAANAGAKLAVRMRIIIRRGKVLIKKLLGYIKGPEDESTA